MTRSVLVIEDNATLAKNVASYLRRSGDTVRTALDGHLGLAQVGLATPDVVLVDYSLPGMNGIEVLRRLRMLHPQVKVIVITGQGSVEIAVEAMKSGACDYLSKPIALADVQVAIDRAMAPVALPRPDAPPPVQGDPGALDQLLGTSPAIRATKLAVSRLLEAEFALKDRDRPTVLITGETGTGKELVARAIHDGGPRHDGPFVELNCAALPSALIESELFGYERGAFTDARERKAGLVELAHSGTLFLDEIGELDLVVQSKLLKLIESRVTRRLGGLRDSRSEVRIITATNQDLERQVALGKFRADLYFRLRIVHLHLPPLRQRGDDILLLARHFLQVHSTRYDKAHLRLTAECEQMLLRYGWPGNVRELRNRLEQAVLMAQHEDIGTEQLALATASSQEAASSGEGVGDLPAQGLVLDDVEESLMRQALDRTQWNVTRAAKLLGVSRDTLRYRIEKFNLKPRADG